MGLNTSFTTYMKFSPVSCKYRSDREHTIVKLTFNLKMRTHVCLLALDIYVLRYVMKNVNVLRPFDAFNPGTVIYLIRM